MLKSTIRFATLTVFTILTVLHQTAYPSDTRITSETPLARVNGVPITLRDLEGETALLAADLQLRNRSVAKEQIGAMRGQMLDNLVERELLYQQAQKTRIAVLPQEVESAMAELQNELGGSAALQNYLTASSQNLSKLRERLRRGLAVQRLLLKEALRNVGVSEAEMEAYYRRHHEYFETGEQVRVRHVLAAVNNWGDEGQRAAARSRLQALTTRALEGEEFSTLAAEFSDCPSKARGGDLGYLTSDQMIKPFADAAMALPVGTISDPVITRFGYHLIQIVDRTPSVRISYNEAHAKIERTLRRNKENAAVERYIASLKSGAAIEKFEPQP